ncbi:MAG: twin-arginine translocation pathway signal protein [Rhodobacterales bacterium]|nr:twin-arginine translocation pathway signal protein [Rhodobacterales bacterium]
MSEKEQNDKTSRRGFLKMASVSAPAAVAAVALSGGEAEAAASGLTGDEAGSGVRDTAHTRAYFESTKF